MSDDCLLHDDGTPAAWALVRVETEGAVDSFCCKSIDPRWSHVCDEHLTEALALARTMHADQPFGVNIHVEELR